MTDTESAVVPTVADVRDARKALAGLAVETPLLESELLNEELGFRLIVKPEVLQRSGSFKFRGAYNRISRIPEAGRAKGVVAFSSGNHGQGVAYAARMFKMPATIVMPADAPQMKVANVKAYGGTVVLYDRLKEDRTEIGRRIAAETGATLVRPFDDRFVIAGQGTIGLEIADQMRARNAKADVVLVPTSGGGLVSGVALALNAESPGTQVYAVEPEGSDDTTRSLQAGEPVANEPGGSALCDALLVPQPGEITFAINRKLLAGGFAVPDDRVLGAMAVAFRHFKIVVEPSGAVGLAVALGERERFRGRTVVAVASGGNVDPALYMRALAGAAAG